MTEQPTEEQTTAGGPALRSYACTACGGPIRYVARSTGPERRRPRIGERDPADEAPALRAARRARAECANCGQGEDLPLSGELLAARPTTGSGGSAQAPATSGSCPACGGQAHLDVHQVSAACSACAGSLLRDDLPGTGWWRIDGLLPVLVDEATARRRVMERASVTRVSPGNRRRYRKAPLQLAYLPCLVFDVDTATTYDGYTHTVYNDPKTQRKTTIRNDVSGTIEMPVQVQILPNAPAQAALPTSSDGDYAFPVGRTPFQAIHLPDDAVAFREQYVAGLAVHLPDGTFHENLQDAEAQIAARVRKEVERDAGGDRQYFAVYNATTSDLRWRLLLAPAWTGTVHTGKAQDREQRIWVDGATGVPHVQTPRSVYGALRILILVLGVLVGIVAAATIVVLLLNASANW